ncbi:MAG: hypothetical protein V3S07_10370 [Micropepsaceae bacterium]
MGRLQQLGLVLAAAFVLSAQSSVGPSYEDLCEFMLKERTEFMEECVAAEAEAHYIVMDWFSLNGLLTPDGEIDSLQLIEAQMNPMRAMYEMPASTAAFCIEITGDWIGMSECIALTDQDSLFMGGNPGMMGPGMGPDIGSGILSAPGTN